MTHRSINGRLRVRSCGLLVEKKKLLLIELHSPVTDTWVWLPPGGEVEFGESLEEAVKREFMEETGLYVSVEQKFEINQIIKPPIHAIEVYFLVKRIGGNLALGEDPELDDDSQILRDIRFFTRKELSEIKSVPEAVLSKVKSLME